MSRVRFVCGFAVLIVGSWACSDDSGPGADAGPDAVQEPDGSACENVMNPCRQEGARTCRQGGVATCVPDDRGCLQWVQTETCGERQECRDSGEGPACTCLPECDQEGAKRCEGNVLQACAVDGDGCRYWNEDQDCAASGMTCIEASGQASCTLDCSNACTPGELRCRGFYLEKCEEADPCPVWKPQQDCTQTLEYCEDRDGPAHCTSCEPPDVGCPQGDACTMSTLEVFACFPAGPKTAGEDCSTEECEPGLICMTYDGSDYLCWNYCLSSEDCPGDDSHCIWPWPDTTEKWGICRPGCDPVKQTGCGQGEACIYMDPDVGSTDCWPAGDLQEGDECDFTELCAAGLDCVADPGSNPPTYHCRRYCDPDHPCPGGFSCIQTEATGALKMCFPD